MMKFFCKKIKMKNNFIKLIAVFIIIFLTGCNSLKEGLEGNKKSKNAEEFLIQKKNPLVLPPDFSKLPTPKNVSEIQTIDDFNLEDILKKESSETNKENISKSNSIEKSVLNKIKDN